MKILFIFLGLISYGYADIFRLCVYPNFHPYCDEMNKGSSEVQCIKVQDSVDCINKLKNNEADFGLFHPEQVHFISFLESIANDIGIVAEARAKEFETRNSSFETVVVIDRKHQINGNMQNLKGLKYCHPGFEYHEKWTPRVRKVFEDYILKNEFKDKCQMNKKKTYVEAELEILSKFFGESCRPGPWTYDEDLDNELKRKYSNLCDLCDNPSACRYNTPLIRNSLDCLDQKQADLAYTTLIEANKIPNKDNYKLLCTNGEVSAISENPSPQCIWRNQPWPLIVGKSHLMNNLQNKLRAWIDPSNFAVVEGKTPFTVSGNEQWKKTLTKILTQNSEFVLNIGTDLTTINSYLSKGNQKLNLPDLKKECPQPMRWCTVSKEENTKCEWVSRASLLAGIDLEINCIPGQNIYDCLKKIKEDQADIIAIDSNFGYIARKYGVNSVLYSQSDINDLATIIAVVPPGSDIQKFDDFKNKKACFPEYRGLAWVSFIENARRRKLIPNNCNFGKSVSEFFDAACAPGANDDRHYRNRADQYPKLCSICSSNCDSSFENEYYDNKGALQCLKTKMADVAFVELETIRNETQVLDYKVICNDGTTKTVSEVIQQGNCQLSQTIDSEIIAKNNDTRKQEYKNALLIMDKLFGSDFQNQRTISMYEKFDGKDNLMFKKNVLGLDDDSSKNQYVINYIDLFEKIDKCTNNSWTVSASGLTILISSLFLLLTRNN